MDASQEQEDPQFENQQTKNSNLISLKVVLTLFYGGFACIYPLLSIAIDFHDFQKVELLILRLAIPLSFSIGVLIIALIAERLSEKYLRVMIAVMLILCVIAPFCLISISVIFSNINQEPSVILKCDDSGDTIIQESCSKKKTCGQNERFGYLTLDKCIYRCQEPDVSIKESEGLPYLSGYEVEEKVLKKIHLITNDTSPVTFRATIKRSTKRSISDGHCYYPLDGVDCNVQMQQQQRKESYVCRIMIQCDVLTTYKRSNVLSNSKCTENFGIPFWSYLVFRSIIDMFVGSVVTLLNAAVIISTQESSTGCRENVGHPMCFSSVGFFGVTLLLIFNYGLPFWIGYGNCLYVILWLSAAFILLFLRPLGPPLLWCNKKGGMLVFPLSVMRKHWIELGAIIFVSALLGSFRSVVYIYEMSAYHETSIDMVWMVIYLPSIGLLWNSERVVNFCGHSNILILEFTIYILRFVGHSLPYNAWWDILMIASEPFMMSITAVSLVLYMRHLVPIGYTIVGQAVPVIAYFGIGNIIVAVLGIEDTDISPKQLQFVIRGMAAAGLVVAIIYVLIYHCVLVKKRAAKEELNGSPHELSSCKEKSTEIGNADNKGTDPTMHV